MKYEVPQKDPHAVLRELYQLLKDESFFAAFVLVNDYFEDLRVQEQVNAALELQRQESHNPFQIPHLRKKI